MRVKSSRFYFSHCDKAIDSNFQHNVYYQKITLDNNFQRFYYPIHPNTRNIKFTIQTSINAFNRHNHKKIVYRNLREIYAEELQQVVNLLIHRLMRDFRESGISEIHES